MREEVRAFSNNQFKELGFDTSDYHFIDEEGTFNAILELKAWSKGTTLRNFLTLEDGRKIIACTFARDNYLGLADVPMGTKMEVTFQRAKKSGQSYLRDYRILEESDCLTP